MLLKDLEKILDIAGFNENTVSQTMGLIGPRWSRKVSQLNINPFSYQSFFNELYENYGQLNPHALHQMVHSQLAIDTAKVKISKAIKHDDERRALELNLGSKEKLYLSQRTLDGIELMLTIQERRSIEVPGYINVNKFEGKNIYLLDEIEIPTILKIKSESDNEEQISCTLGFFQYLFTSLYGGKIPDNLSLQGIENFVLGSIDQESQEKLDISYKFSNCNSLGDYIISNANHFAISTRDNIFSNFFSHDFLNKVPIHTHPQLESRLNDNRYPSEEIVFLEETNFFVSQNGGKTRLPFQLIATTYDSKKWITAYSLDDEENYHISIFQI